jgi:biotin operon repressor
MSEWHTTASLAAELGISSKTLRKKARALNIGIDLEGRAGFRYSDADRQRLIESLRPTEQPKQQRRRRRAA